jgi:hypothetical protein
MTAEWLLPIAMGVALAAYGGHQFRLLRAACKWDQVRARVLSADAVESWDAGFPRYYPRVSFEVEIGERRMRSHRFGLDVDDFAGERPEVEQLLSSYKTDSMTTAFRDPRPGYAPALRIDVPRHRRMHYGICVFAGWLLAALGVVGGIYLAP